MLGLGVVVAAFLSAPTFAVWILAFLNAKPAWRKDDDAAEGGMENDVNAKAYAMRSGVDTAAATHFTTTALRFCRALSAEPQKLQPNRVQRAPASRHFPAIP